MTVVRNLMDRVVPLLISPTWHFFLEKAAGDRAGEAHLPLRALLLLQFLPHMGHQMHVN